MRCKMITRHQFLNSKSINPVYNFLITNRNYAFTRTEIAEKLKMEPNEVSSSLRYLKEMGTVLHRKPFWMVK